eukprot:4345544-Alexandrium_andersonii.AAC.1
MQRDGNIFCVDVISLRACKGALELSGPPPDHPEESTRLAVQGDRCADQAIRGSLRDEAS